jgi:hypothetical protein
MIALVERDPAMQFLVVGVESLAGETEACGGDGAEEFDDFVGEFWRELGDVTGICW